MKKLLMAALGFFSLNTYAQREIESEKKIIWEFDFNQPSFFLKTYLDGGCYDFTDNDNTNADLDEKNIRFTYFFNNPIFSMWKYDIYNKAGVDCLTATTRIQEEQSKKYVKTTYLFANWRKRRRMPDLILTEKFDDEGKMLSKESESISFDSRGKPSTIKHFYNNALVYKEEYSLSPNHSDFTLKRKNFFGDSIGVVTNVFFHTVTSDVNFTYHDQWNIHFKQRPQKFVYYQAGMSPASLIMVEKFYDTTGFLKSERTKFEKMYSPDFDSLSIDEKTNILVVIKDVIIYNKLQMSEITQLHTINDNDKTVLKTTTIVNDSDMTNVAKTDVDFFLIYSGSRVTSIVTRNKKETLSRENISYDFQGCVPSSK